MLDVLLAWLGAGGRPVETEVAKARLSMCLHCPENRPGNWWEVHFKEPIAEEIRKHLEVKYNVGLTIPDEEKTGMCRSCGCCIRLKIWTPAEHLKEHTDTEVKARLPDFCWQKKLL